MNQSNPNNPVPNFFLASAEDFKKIPASPIAYWISAAFMSLYDQRLIGSKFEAKEGVGTRNDDVFMRMAWEVHRKNVSKDKRWILTDKAGDFRKWFIGTIYLMDWEFDGHRIKTYRNDDGSLRSRPQNTQYLFKEGVSWGKIGSGIPSFRWRPAGFGFNDAAPTLFGSGVFEILGQLNSIVTIRILTIRGSTLNITTGVVAEVPLLELNEASKLKNNDIIKQAIELSCGDWNSYEISWDFTILPLLHLDHHQPTLKSTYGKIRAHWQSMTLEMQRLEEENNRIFIEAYGLQDELTPDVPLSEITLTCNPHYRYNGNKTEEELEALLRTDTIKELVSYAIGCMMGRYSLDKPGLIYAHSGNIGFDPSAYQTFPADDDGIIPVMDQEWFPDDATNRFVKFIKIALPPEYLDENLKFIADSLGPKTNEMPVDTIRRYISTGFFKDHLKTYKKRPIYWLFSSGKLKAFECLVYLHRYNESTLSRMRSSYVTPLQGNFSARLEYFQNELDAAAATTAKRKIQKEIDQLKKKMAELKTFDDHLRHYADMRISLDLDDGVKVNYGKFGNLLAERKAITGN